MTSANMRASWLGFVSGLTLAPIDSTRTFAVSGRAVACAGGGGACGRTGDSAGFGGATLDGAAAGGRSGGRSCPLAAGGASAGGRAPPASLMSNDVLAVAHRVGPA
jgi:hypothetical protein